jgi:metal-responsive CopG/Arc/MetJ family transcriptional regulator
VIVAFNNEQYQREYYRKRRQEVAFISLQLSHEELAELDAVAKRDKVCRSEKLREIITWALEDDRARQAL